MNILTRAKQVLFSPTSFFSSIEKEKGVKKPFLYLAVILIIPALLYPVKLYYEKDVLNLVAQSLQLNIIVTAIMFMILGYAIPLLVSFVTAFVLNIWLKAFKGKQSFYQAYKLSVYSNTPSYLTSWIPFIGGLFIIYSLILLIIGTKQLYKFSSLKAALIYLIPTIIILVFLLILVFIAYLSLASLQTFTIPSGF